jgi:hypothetical protein
MYTMTEKEREKFGQALARLDEHYDPAEQLLAWYLDKPAVYASAWSGTAHNIRTSLDYAVALLDSGTEQNRLRAIDVVQRVIALQDTDPLSATFGIWSWYLEEPLDKMTTPDYNWADFCGIQLLQITLDHVNRIPDELQGRVKQAIRNACASIMKRKVPPTYTNVAIMDVYVTLVAGERFSWEETLEFGRKQLWILYDFTLKNGTFTEYNSPTYTVTALTDLTRILDHVQDAQCRNMAEELHRLAWRCIAIHFHPPTGQWAGPHARCYHSLQGNGLWSLLQLATGGKVRFLEDEDVEIGIDYPRLRFRCPEEFIPYFQRLEQPRTEKESFTETYYLYDPFFSNHLDPEGPKQEATVFHTPAFSLGTFRVSDLWNQRRALVAYWGKRERPSYLHLRCLKGGFDYSSAVLGAVQSEGRVLGAVQFATDGGDTHLYLDKVRNATIEVADFRLRFEFGGDLDQLVLPASWQEGETALIRSGDLTIRLHVPYARFGSTSVRFETGRDQQTAWFDIVLYSGERKLICFSDLEEACCAFALDIAAGTDAWERPFPKPAFSTNAGSGLLTWKPVNESLRLTTAVQPHSILELYAMR